jgi:hypothetical protein
LICKILFTQGEEKQLQRIKDIEFELMAKPENFDVYDPENIIKRSDDQYAEMVALMEDNGATNAQDLTEYEFYTRVDYLKRKFEPGKK